MYPYCLCKHWKWLGAVLLCSRWCGYFLQQRCFVGQLLALLPQQPTFDESFKLMLLRLHGFNFAISLARGPSSSFFFWIPCELIQWRPKMASRFIRKPFPPVWSKTGTLLSSNYGGSWRGRCSPWPVHIQASRCVVIDWCSSPDCTVTAHVFVAVSSQRGRTGTPAEPGGCHQGDQPHLSGN